ncbi:MAG: hypothetical protein II888_05800 [Clostridia bacterium]|nr:hypothetical protein [Clostridia bacterium]
MRCSCKVCGPEIWMVQADSDRLGCVCTVCGYRCNDCLGTDTVVPRSNLSALAGDPRFSPERLSRLFEPEAEDEDGWTEENPWNNGNEGIRYD